MKREKIKEKVVDMLIEILDGEKIDIREDDSIMDDLDLSSLEMGELFVMLEQEFKFRIPEKKIREFVLLKDIIDYIFEEKRETI